MSNPYATPPGIFFGFLSIIAKKKFLNLSFLHVFFDFFNSFSILLNADITVSMPVTPPPIEICEKCIFI